MSSLLVSVCIVGFVLANTCSSILFKIAADNAGKTALGYFIVGNLVGALAPIALTFALRLANANVVYAFCYGGAFALLQLTAWRLFHQPISGFQTAGIVLVGTGIWLLQLGRA